MTNPGVIVKLLNAIENLGSIEVLCTDKIGTLTKGVVQLDRALDISGQPNQSLLNPAYLKAALMISKGAVRQALDVCDQIKIATATTESLTAEHRRIIQRRFAAWSEQGYRVLGVAQKSIALDRAYGRDDERAMEFVGYLLFFDPPEDGVRETLH